MEHTVQVVSKGDIISFTYTNYKGETAEREAEVFNFLFGSSEYHTEPQWLLNAWDRKKNKHRTFAMKYITNLKYLGSAR